MGAMVVGCSAVIVKWGWLYPLVHVKVHIKVTKMHVYQVKWSFQKSSMQGQPEPGTHLLGYICVLASTAASIEVGMHPHPHSTVGYCSPGEDPCMADQLIALHHPMGTQAAVVGASTRHPLLKHDFLRACTVDDGIMDAVVPATSSSAL
jgi:hypothetical protein